MYNRKQWFSVMYVFISRSSLEVGGAYFGASLGPKLGVVLGVSLGASSGSPKTVYFAPPLWKLKKSFVVVFCVTVVTFNVNFNNLGYPKPTPKWAKNKVENGAKPTEKIM